MLKQIKLTEEVKKEIEEEEEADNEETKGLKSKAKDNKMTKINRLNSFGLSCNRKIIKPKA